MAWEAALLGAQGGSSLIGGFFQARALRARGEYQARMLRLNAEISRFQAKDAIERGDKSVDAYNAKIAALIGSQRVGYAAQGVVVGEGSAAEVAADTAAMGAEDAVMIRANAWREAWGHRVQAQDYLGQAEMAKIGANFQATQSILTGIGDAASAGIKMAGQSKSDGLRVPGVKMEAPEIGSGMRKAQQARTPSLGSFDLGAGLGYEDRSGYRPLFPTEFSANPRGMGVRVTSGHDLQDTYLRNVLGAGLR